MKAVVWFLALFLVAASGPVASAFAEEICGNPCPTGYVWTDKNMGMCVPAPELPTS